MSFFLFDAIDSLTGSDISGKNATRGALASQTSGMNQANETLASQYNQGNQALLDSYNLQQGILSPYQQAGNQALSSLASGDFANNLSMDPGYQFRLKEGQKALEGSAAARGGLNSGATMKALTRYAQDYASNEYNNAYNRDYQRLSQLAGYGQNAATNLFGAAGNYGTQLNSNLTGYGQSVSNNLTGLANANAAAQIGQANRESSLFGGLLGLGGALGGGYLAGRSNNGSN